MKKLIYAFLLLILTACPSGNENFNPGLPSADDAIEVPVELPTDTIELEKPTDTILKPEIPNKPEKPENPIPEPEPEPTPEPSPEPEPEQPENIPSKENPLVWNVAFNTNVKLNWLPVENAEKYLVEVRYEDQYSYITRGRDITKTEFVDDRSEPGDKSRYRVWAYANNDKFLIADEVFTEIPEAPEFVNGTLFPDEIPANAKVFKIYADFNSTEDQTVHIQKQIDAVPNGTPEQYHILEFHGDKIWTEGNLKDNPRGWEGAISLVGRRYLIIKGADNKRITFYTKAPGVPLGSSIGARTHSLRVHFKLKHFTNIWFHNVTVEGGNSYLGDTVGTTPELTPDWWWIDYRPADTSEIEKFESIAPDQKWYELYKESTRVAEWYLMSREVELLAGREVPQEIVKEPNAGKKSAYYRIFLQQNLKVGELVPRNPDTGATNTSVIWQPEWENEHGIDAQEGSYLRITNYECRYVFGDGIALHDVENVEIDNALIESVGRQNVGIGRGVVNLKVDNSKFLNPRRSPFDVEAFYRTEVIDGVYVTNSYIGGRMAAAGSGTANNLTFENNPRITQVTYKGLPERRRKNFVLDRTDHIGGFQTPLAIVRVEYTDNVTITNNYIWCPDTSYAGRRAFDVRGCGGKILIEGNTYKYPSIIHVRETLPDAEVIINEDYPDNVYVITYTDGREEIIGNNPELLKKL